MNNKTKIAIWIILASISLPLEADDTHYFEDPLILEPLTTPFRAWPLESTPVDDVIRSRHNVRKLVATVDRLPAAIAGDPVGDMAAFLLPPSQFKRQLSAAISSAPQERIRAKLINWIKRRDETAGTVSDFLLPGSHLALHLEVDPGDDEVVLEWDLQF